MNWKLSISKSNVLQYFGIVILCLCFNNAIAQGKVEVMSSIEELKLQNIHEAACDGNIVQLTALLKEGVSINLKDKKGNTPLKKAIACKQPKAIDFLLANNADVNSVDNSGRTLLYDSAHNSNTALLKQLLAHNANPNLGDSSGMYPIHKAVLNENLESVQQLVNANADIHIKSHRGNTPLDLAIREGYSEIATFLSKKRASKNDKPTSYGGGYIDEELPGLEPKIFAYNFISTENKTQNAIFHPNGKEYYYTVETINNPGIIRMSKLVNNQWTAPIPAAIPGVYREVDPFITSDGSKLFFCWDKPVDGLQERTRNMDIWMMHREDDNWSEPIHLGMDVNTDEHDWFPTVSKNGTLYFSTGKFPESNVYYSEFKDGKYQKAIQMGDAINTKDRDFAPFIADDESYIIFSSNRSNGVGNSDLYISFKNKDGSWAKAKNMESVNSTKADFGPSLSLDGKYLFFTSWREGTASDVYWVDSKVIENLKIKK